ncbi:MAG: hypothetical protein BroJett003_03560 [Planctomycetota bacterium]|nr:MAG: hypothetical protein BroJett003_03560 [Planctomycetota bacterium]
MDAFLDALAAKTPTPGGGAAAAATGAIACALGEMVAAYSIRKDADATTRSEIEHVRSGLANCRAMLRRLADEDAAAYQALTEARSRMRDGGGDRVALETAALAAASVPLEIAAAVSTALALLHELAPRSNKHLLSDLGAAGVLAFAAARAAETFVKVNLPSLPAGSTSRSGLASELEHVMTHARTLAAAIEAFPAVG